MEGSQLVSTGLISANTHTVHKTPHQYPQKHTDNTPQNTSAHHPVCEFCILRNLTPVPHVCAGTHSFLNSFFGERHNRSALCFCMKQHHFPSKQHPFSSNHHNKLPFNPSLSPCFHSSKTYLPFFINSLPTRRYYFPPKKE